MSCWKKREKLQTLHDEAVDRIENDLDLIKVVRNMRNFKILLKTFLMTEKVKFEVAHQAKNIIDLEEEDEEDSVEVSKPIKKQETAKMFEESKKAVLKDFNIGAMDQPGCHKVHDETEMSKTITLKNFEVWTKKAQKSVLSKKEKTVKSQE